jgi:hypothetical protein
MVMVKFIAARNLPILSSGIAEYINPSSLTAAFEGLANYDRNPFLR